MLIIFLYMNCNIVVASDTELKDLSLISDNANEPFNEENIDAIINEFYEEFGLNSKKLYSKINNLDKLNEIKGTWIVSYTVGLKRYTDKLVIDGTFTSSAGALYASGLLYSNLSVLSSKILSCGYDPDTFSYVNADYFCIGVDSLFLDGYAFSFQANTITSGKYGIGTSSSALATSIVLSGNYLSGYRIPETAPQSVAPTPLPTPIPVAPSTLTPASTLSYQSTYQTISWSSIASTEYCIDITDENWNIFTGYQGLQCGKGFSSFSPADYVRTRNLSLQSGYKFNWRVWSKTIFGTTQYGGQGYEGQVIVP